MSNRFVRASKYRHVYGQVAKKELCYDNLRISKNAWDSNIIQANSKYLSVNWESAGGGAFAVIPLNEVGKAPDVVPLFRGHTSAVLDTLFSPFNDRIIASASDDGKIGIWEIPEDYSFVDYTNSDGEAKNIAPIKKLLGHLRKVGHVQFHPLAENVLVSASNDYTVKVWNVVSGKPILLLQHKDLVTLFAFSHDGNRLATTSRDKRIRVWDLRTGELLQEGQGHAGAKNPRCVWLGTADRIATTGFLRLLDRQLGIWDASDLGKGPIGGFINIDASAGILMPFFDDLTNMLYVAGKGDGNIRYYEYTPQDDEIYDISEFQSLDPQRGFAVAPKRAVNVKENEIIRAYKTVRDSCIEPISFIVPRRAEMFQFDIYPDAPSSKPAMTADEWVSGKKVPGPILFNMESLYDSEVTTEYSSTAAESKPIKKSEPPKPVEKKPEAKPEPVTTTKADPKPSSVKSTSVDGLLGKNEVSLLLEKSKNLDEQNGVVVADNEENDEFAEKPIAAAPKREISTPKRDIPGAPTLAPLPPKSERKETEVKATEEKPKSEPKETKPKVETKTEPKTEPKSEPKTQAKAEPKTETKETPKPTAILKGTAEKLAALVDKLEGQIEALQAAAAEREERLALVEKKVDELLKK